jgi:hypothetical protein
MRNLYSHFTNLILAYNVYSVVRLLSFKYKNRQYDRLISQPRICSIRQNRYFLINSESELVNTIRESMTGKGKNTCINVCLCVYVYIYTHSALWEQCKQGNLSELEGIRI